MLSYGDMKLYYSENPLIVLFIKIYFYFHLHGFHSDSAHGGGSSFSVRSNNHLTICLSNRTHCTALHLNTTRSLDITSCEAALSSIQLFHSSLQI